MQKSKIEYLALNKVVLTVTVKCNRSCIFCPHQFMNFYDNFDIQHKTVINLCNNLTSSFVGIFSIGGFGEPTMNKNLNDITQTIKKICPKCKIHIITNGYDLILLNKCYVDLVQISIYDAI
jgi:molybdenum cofactor biosynthesis enzyme MoaA